MPYTARSMPKPLTDKFAVAAALQEIGALLEYKGGEFYKARAYKTGARSIAELNEDLDKVIKQNRLTFVKGVGAAIAKQILELYSTGESSLLEQLRQELPPGIIELGKVPGLSVKKVTQLHQVLGISSVEELKAACEAGKVRDVKGFGPKSEQAILAAIDAASIRERRTYIHHALRAGERIVEYLRTEKAFMKGELAGAARRREETVTEVVIVAAAKRPAALIHHFAKAPFIARTHEKTANWCSVSLTDGVEASLFVVTPEEFAGTLLLATGSDAHLRRLQLIAEKRKLRITSRGIEKVSPAKGTKPAAKNEADIYRGLGLQHVAPELREDHGEIEAALKGALPEDLVTVGDICGMVHCHTTYSDGKHTLAQMVHAAEAMGMKYITITDHSPTAFYAGGVKIDRLQQQWEDIDLLQEETRIKILKGTESDILADGELDYPDWILEQFDVIVASIHSRYKMGEEQMTRRIIRAMRQPLFKIWGHALGRKLQQRPPFDCRVEEILDVIAESRAAIEINGDPYRLDLEPRWVREARKRKIKFVISVDAHSMAALHNLEFGVGIARRGWVRRKEVLNTLNVKAFQKAVRPIEL